MKFLINLFCFLIFLTFFIFGTNTCLTYKKAKNPLCECISKYFNDNHQSELNYEKYHIIKNEFFIDCIQLEINNVTGSHIMDIFSTMADSILLQNNYLEMLKSRKLELFKCLESIDLIYKKDQPKAVFCCLGPDSHLSKKHFLWKDDSYIEDSNKCMDNNRFKKDFEYC